MKFIYTFTLLFILFHTISFSAQWEVMDNNSTVKNPNGDEFHFKTYEMDELYGIFYTVNLNNTNGILYSLNKGYRWEVSFFETRNIKNESNAIYDLVKQGDQLYAPAEPNSIHILNSKSQEWTKVRISDDSVYPLTRLQFVNDSVGFIGYHFVFGFYKTTDKGETWKEFKEIVPQLKANFKFRNYVAKNENEIYLVGSVDDSLCFYKTTNSGIAWTSFQSEQFEKSDLIIQAYYNLKYEEPYFYVENRYKQTSDGNTTMMRSSDFVTWEPVFVSNFIDFGKFIHSFKFYGNKGFALGTQVFLYTEDGGDTWVDLYDKNDKFYENKNPINGFFLYEDYLYASGAIEEKDDNGNLIRIAKFFKYNTKNITSVYEDRVNITLYPNPSFSVINLESEEIVESYEILDLSGKVVSRNTANQYQNQLSINIEGLISGSYFIRINEKIYKRFVKN